MKKQIVRRMMIPNQGPFIRLPEQPSQLVRHLSQPKGISPMAHNGITKTVRITQAGIARIGKARRLAAAASADGPTSISTDTVKEWVNLLLTAAGREDLLLPDAAMDSSSLRHRMGAVTQSIQASLNEGGSTGTEEVPNPLEPDSRALTGRQSGKQRQLGKKKLGFAEAAERGRRFVTRGY